MQIWVANSTYSTFQIYASGNWNINLPATAAGVGDLADGSKLLTVTIASSTPLPTGVNYTDLLSINWQVKPGNANWISAGTSQNQAYATLAYPTEGVPVYHSTIDVSCRSAIGATTDDAVILAHGVSFKHST